MFCPRCGSQIQEGDQFCITCGTPIRVSSASPVPEKKRTKIIGFPQKPEDAPMATEVSVKTQKKVPAAAIVIVIAAAAAALFAYLFFTKKPDAGGSNYLLFENNLFFSGEDLSTSDENVFIAVDRTDTWTLSGDLQETKMSANGKRAVIRAAEDVQSSDYSSILYDYDQGSEPVEICRGGGYAAVSRDGSTLLYETGGDGETDARLYLRSQSGPDQLLAEGKYIYSISLSPDGDTAVYTVEDSVGMKNRYLWDGNSTLRNDLPENITAISDDAKLIWYRRNSEDCCVLANGQERVLGTDAYYTWLNFDNTEAVFYGSDGIYLSVNGEDPVKLYDKVCNYLLPYGVQSGMENFETIYVGIRHFADSYMTCIDYSNDTHTVLYIDDDHHVKPVVSGVSESALTNDGKTVVFLKDGMIYRTTGTKNEVFSAEPVASDASVFQMTDDGNTIYYINSRSSGDLYAVSGKDDPVFCLSGVTSLTESNRYSPFFLMESGKRLYAVSHNTDLYLLEESDPSNPELLNSYPDDISSVYSAGPLASVSAKNAAGYYFTDVYRDGKKLTLITNHIPDSSSNS